MSQQKVIGYEVTPSSAAADLIELQLIPIWNGTFVSIDGVGLRGRILKGGLRIEKATFITTVIDYLLGEGYSIGVPAENTHNYVDGEEV